MTENILEKLSFTVEEFMLNMNSYIREALQQQPDKALELLRDQLMSGKAYDGDDIRPYYSEDNYFKTRESAYKYAKYKAEITPDPRRHWDAPNLYVDGTFHSEIGVRYAEADFIFYGTTSYAKEIMQKYGSQIDLGTEGCEILSQMVVPILLERLREKLNLR